MALEKVAVTVDAFEAFIALPENADRRFELIDGEIAEMSPTQEHGMLVVALVVALAGYLRTHPIGRLSVETRHRLPGDALNDRLPDISLMLGVEREIIREGAVPFMPDLAVEVQSPDDSIKRMRDKAAFYLAHGSRAVWLVFPDKRIIEVYTADDQLVLTPGDTLTGGDLLPGFALSVADVFEAVR